MREYFFKKQFSFVNFTTSREGNEFDTEIKKLRNWLAPLDSVESFCEGVSLDSKFCTKMEKKLLKMEQFFCIVKNYFLFKQMFNVDAVLDGKPIDYKVHQSLGAFSFCSFF